MQEINMFCHTPEPLNATAFYRSWGVFPYVKKLLAKESINLNVYEMPRKLDWRAMTSINLVHFERPHTKEDVANIIHLKRHNIGIWVDYDDNLFDIPIDNPAHDYYKNQDTNNILRCLDLADVVTVSTENLKKHYGPKSKVICNALPAELYAKPIPKRDPYIVWRGGLTHEGDIYGYWDQIKEILKTYQILFVGATPGFIKYESKTNKNIKLVPPMKLEDYFLFLQTINPKCFIVPLDDNEFNQGKSNIAYLEALVAGAMTVAPNWTEWYRIACHGYDTKVQSYAAIHRAVKGIMDNETDWESNILESRKSESLNYHLNGLGRADIIKQFK